MSLKTNKSTRTKYRNIISKELEVSKSLVSLDVYDLDDNECRHYMKEQKKCVTRLTEFSEKLEITNNALLLQLETESADDSDDLNIVIDENCELMSHVIDCKSDLSDLAETLTKRTHTSASDTELGKMIELQQQMQTMMISHQEHLYKQQEDAYLQQKDFFRELKREHTTAVKLPMLDLHSFSGDRLKWKEFWDAFESSVHNNTKLTPNEKLTYLNSKLVGEAKSTISGLSISNENYVVAVKLLHERFGDA